MSASPNRFCPQCGAPLALNALVCSACGSSIPNPPSLAPTQWASSRYSEAPHERNPSGPSSQSHIPPPPAVGVPSAPPAQEGSKNAVARTRPVGVTVLAILVGLQGLGDLLYFLVALSMGDVAGLVTFGVVAVVTSALAWGLWTLRPSAFWAAIVLEVLYLVFGGSNLALSASRGNIHIGLVLLEVVIPLAVLICLFAVGKVRAAILGK